MGYEENPQHYIVKATKYAIEEEWKYPSRYLSDTKITQQYIHQDLFVTVQFTKLQEAAGIGYIDPTTWVVSKEKQYDMFYPFFIR